MHTLNSGILEIEKSIFSRFKLQTQQYFGNQARSELDWLIYARHYGLNTRMLDWTKSVYVALYFALQGRSKTKHEPFSIIAYKNPNIKSYFELTESNPFGINEDVFFEPPTIDLRISNQQAILSIHHNPSEEMMGENIIQFNLFPGIDDLKEIESDLIEVGIRHSTIYPGPDGIAKHLNENPHEMDASFHLKVEGPHWKPVTKWMVGKTQKEIERIILKEKSFLALLEMYSENPSDVIGLPVHLANNRIGYFRSYFPVEKCVIFLNQDGKSTITVEIGSEEIKKIKTTTSALKVMLGKKITFIRENKAQTSPNDAIMVNKKAKKK